MTTMSLMMKIKSYKLLFAIAILINCLIILFLYFSLSYPNRIISGEDSFKHVHEVVHRLLAPYSISSRLTLIIREFEDFENDVIPTIKHLKALVGNVSILVLVDKLPYPPIHFVPLNISVIEVNFDLHSKVDITHVKSFIKTEFVLFIPDGVRIIELSSVLKLLNHFEKSQLVRAYAVQTGKSKLKCPGMSVNTREWTIQYTDFEGSEGMCDYVEGDHAILLRTEDLAELPSPFTRPLHKSIYIQFILKKWKIAVYSSPVFQNQLEFKDPHSQWKHKHLEDERTKELFNKFKIKSFSIDNQKKFYYGCTKDTQRCFGTVVNDVPDFVYQGRWTPPCCLKAIRETAQYVFSVFEANSIRYWLEGGSLLGAARNGDIIPWDYDVDIGIYMDDITECKQLRRAANNEQSYDGDFVWTKAEEGEFFRVYYSDVNKNHVDIFPFYSKNGTMTKNTWFKTHRQDTKFPEHFLKPLTKIYFVGMNVSAPNNVKEFLEFKFGKGVIENPKYPNSEPVF